MPASDPVEGREFDAVLALGQRLAAHLQQFIVPLFRLDDEGEATQFGSGFLVKSDGGYYLVSAAHVLDEVSECRVGFPIGGRTFRVLHPSNYRSTPLPESGRRQDDRVDIGVLRLSGTLLPPYREAGKDAMPLEWLSPSPLTTANHFLLIGFPESKSKVDRMKGIQISGYWPVAAGAVSREKFDRLKLNPDVHLALTWQKRHFLGRGKKRVSPISPVGMSGSPVFLPFGEADADLDAGVIVAGILIEKRNRDSILVATKAIIAAEMILRLSGNS